MMNPTVRNPFELVEPSGGRPLQALQRVAAGCVERVFGLSTLASLYSVLPPDRLPEDFCQLALDALAVTWEVSSGSINAIPPNGPLVVVANHPYGGLDGLVAGAIVRRTRRDVKFLGNHLLGRVPELRDQTISVDPFPGGLGSNRNVRGLRAAIRWVKGGGALLMFPAGEVAHLDARRRRIAESPWLDGVGLIVRAAGATVLPLHVAGTNRAFFHVAGLVHPRLRTLLLPREMLGKRHTTIRVQVGSPIPFARLRRFDEDRATAAYLQARCELLGARHATTEHRPGTGQVLRALVAGGRAVVARGDRRATAGMDIADPVPPDRLAAEIAALPRECALTESGEIRILVGRAFEIPGVLEEIGRLREVTFRAVGEGTGGSCDLDAFDQHYLHLFAWHAGRREVIGAYRLGPTDEILPDRGGAGLYTATLFRYEEELFRRLNPALELGRAFVRCEYQRDYAPLMLLWKGIARFVADRPRYRRLFGPVSISNDYDSVSKRILVAFLEAHRRLPDLARFVRPRRSPQLGALKDWDPALLGALTADEGEVNAIVSELERHQRAMPVLLRQYLKLNGRLLAFNVDPAFGHALDGLMLVDLLDVEPTILARYMGASESAVFRAYHSPSAPLESRSGAVRVPSVG